MTDKPNEQGDALTPAAIATMREMGCTEAQIGAQRQQAERERAAGGFSQYVRKVEAARLFSEAVGFHHEPEHMDLTEYDGRAEWLAAHGPSWDKPRTPEWWADALATETAERQGWAAMRGEEMRLVARANNLRTLEAAADDLPLLQWPNGEAWPKGQPLPDKWRNGLFMRKAGLRAWAKEHAPDLLGSALLAAEATRRTLVNWDDMADVSIPGGMHLISKRRALDILVDATLGPIPEATMDGAIRKSRIPAFASLIGNAPTEELTKDEWDWLELAWNLAGLDWPEHPTKTEWETRYLAAFRQAADRPDWTPVSTWGLNQKIAEQGRELTRQRYEADVFTTLQEYGRTGFSAQQGQGGHWNIEDVKAAVARIGRTQAAPAVEAATIAGPGAGVHRIQSRAAPLDSLIIKARREASNPNDRHAVFAVLQAWAASGTCPAPIVGYAEGDGIKYRDGDDFKYLTSDKLRKRAAMTRTLPPSAA